MNTTRIYDWGLGIYDMSESRHFPAVNSKSQIPNPKSRRRSRRPGIVLLLVVSLLALFVLLGATFTVVALHAVNASKLELKTQQTLDDPTSEMDFVLGQILYDTQARTVLQYHSLLRDLYGYDADNLLQPVNISPVPQFRESFQGTVIPT